MGGFYSSIDADSKSLKGEDKEGAYYVWKEDELKKLLKDEFIVFSEYYNINTIMDIGKTIIMS